MTPEEVRDRALAQMPGDDAARFDPITIAILMAVVSWLVTKCLNRLSPNAVRNPGMIRRWQLRNAVRACCADPAVLDAAGGRYPGQADPDAIDAAYGDRVHAALLAAGVQAEDHEIRSFLGSPP